MTFRDHAGNSISGATAESLAAFEQASHELRCYIDDPAATVERALEFSPAMTMAHILKAWLHLLGTEPAGLPVARQSLEAARRLPANDREHGHLEAIGKILDGRWRDAGRILEDVSATYPRDALALQAGHQIDFFTGDARMLRDRIARALPAWSASVPGYHAVLGMYAFGLEECGDYVQAEHYGRESVARERRDGWGWHAVAHVMEMQKRSRDGIEWLRADRDAWAQNSFFAVHNNWHLALFHLDQGDTEEVLQLFDGPIHGARSSAILDLIDASALLWRLQTRGVAIGDRWQTVADAWAPLAGHGNYAFNDFHAMMAFTGAQRPKACKAVIESLERAARGDTDTAAFAREVGLNATRAIEAFAQGRYNETVRLLRPLRSYAHRFGGSHAQRDLIDLTLIEAARRAGMTAYTNALTAERAARFPHSPLAQLQVQRSTATHHAREEYVDA